MLPLFLISAVAIGLMVLGLSITQIRKGRDLQSDVGGNDDMKRLGLTCASAQARREEAALRGEEYDGVSGCSIGSCETCTEHEQSCSTDANQGCH